LEKTCRLIVLISYSLEFDFGWNEYYAALDNSIKERAKKQLRKLKEGLDGRHLKHGLDYFVLEFGQHRICYKTFAERKVKRVYFVGDHKEYEKWLGLIK